MAASFQCNLIVEHGVGVVCRMIFEIGLCLWFGCLVKDLMVDLIFTNYAF